MVKENISESVKNGAHDDGHSSSDSGDLESQTRRSLDKETGYPNCRVCQCAESDKRGDAALRNLGISPPFVEESSGDTKADSDCKEVLKNISSKKNAGNKCGVLQFISPTGEVFVCSGDLEMGTYNQDLLVELGCSCKNDLSLVHYACALKWFINHGSTVCEICGNMAKNIRISDFNKVVSLLKEYEALRERTASGEPISAQVQTSQGVDPDAVAGIRRQRLSEISQWFNPHNASQHNNIGNNSTAISQVASEHPSSTISEDVDPTENRATKWAVEGTGILLATGLLTVTLAWLIAPHVGKKTAKSGLHILLGGICALTVVIFFRFFVLTRIKYGPARYWAILFVFWFLVFGIWASRTHASQTT